MNTYRVKVREWQDREIVMEAPSANAVNDIVTENLKILSIEVTKQK